MRYLVGIAALAMLAIVAPANAVPISDGLNTADFSPLDPDVEGLEGEDWADGTTLRMLVEGSATPAGWRFAQQTWNESTKYMVSADTTNFTEGDASMRLASQDANLSDCFFGVMVDGLTPGESYTVSFDFRADVELGQYDTSPGLMPGDDYVNSVSYNFMAVANEPNGWLATEDFPGHLTGSTWIGNDGSGNYNGDWDGNWHAQSTTYVATAPAMAFVAKIRTMWPENAGINIDNFQVTPEPASLALIGLGGLVMMRRRR